MTNKQIIIGLDMGISSTKVVTLQPDGQFCGMEIWPGGDIQALLQAYLDRLDLQSDAPICIAATGVGSLDLGDQLMGFPVTKVGEFTANGTAARQYCKEEKFLVVSAGTGTSFVLVDGNQFTHLGGSALGGGTLMALQRMFLPGMACEEFVRLAEQGNCEHVDWQIGDVCSMDLPGLPRYTTTSNLARISSDSQPADIAAGLLNLVLQNIGVMAHLACTGHHVQTCLLIGRLVSIPGSKEIYRKLEQLYDMRFILPDQPTQLTAKGCALHLKNKLTNEL